MLFHRVSVATNKDAPETVCMGKLRAIARTAHPWNASNEGNQKIEPAPTAPRLDKIISLLLNINGTE
jgi:hypothetical protein